MKSSIMYSILCVLMSISVDVMAQKTFQPKTSEFDWKGIVYRKERAYEFRLHTNGALFAVNFGEIKTYYKTRYYHLSLGVLKDPREKRQNKNISLNFPDRSSSFAFGKQNSVFNLRAGIGVKRFLSEKANRKGIAIGYDYEIGPSIALLKPYYLELIYDSENPSNGIRSELRTEKFTDENASVFTNYDDIFGGAGFFTGFDELSIVPGIQTKLGLFFSLGAFDKYVKAVETGFMADVFIRKIPIMIESDEISNKPYFFNFYVNFLFGKRSN